MATSINKKNNNRCFASNQYSEWKTPKEPDDTKLEDKFKVETSCFATEGTPINLANVFEKESLFVPGWKLQPNSDAPNTDIDLDTITRFIADSNISNGNQLSASNTYFNWKKPEESFSTSLEYLEEKSHMKTEGTLLSPVDFNFNEISLSQAWSPSLLPWSYLQPNDTPGIHVYTLPKSDMCFALTNQQRLSNDLFPEFLSQVSAATRNEKGRFSLPFTNDQIKLSQFPHFESANSNQKNWYEAEKPIYSEFVKAEASAVLEAGFESLYQSYKLGSIHMSPLKDQLISSAGNLLLNVGRTYLSSEHCLKSIRKLLGICQNDDALTTIHHSLRKLAKISNLLTIIEVLQILQDCCTNSITPKDACIKVMKALGSYFLVKYSGELGLAVGAIVGTAVGGPAGGFVFGALGSWLGKKVGKSIWEMILEALQWVVEFVKSLL